jgi:hypothetical protein
MQIVYTKTTEVRRVAEERVDEVAHEDTANMPAARHETPEWCLMAGLRIDVKRLGVELTSEPEDRLLRHRRRSELKYGTDREVTEVSHRADKLHTATGGAVTTGRQNNGLAVRAV